MKTVKLRIVSHRSVFLDKFVNKFLYEVDKEYVTVLPLPTKSRLFTVLKSPFVNKKSREQFKLETHKRIIVLKGKEIKKIPKMLKNLSSNNIAIKVVLKGG